MPLDLFNAADDRLLGQVTGFVGYHKASGTEHAGPNGVVAVGADLIRYYPAAVANTGGRRSV